MTFGLPIVNDLGSIRPGLVVRGVIPIAFQPIPPPRKPPSVRIISSQPSFPAQARPYWRTPSRSETSRVVPNLEVVIVSRESENPGECVVLGGENEPILCVRGIQNPYDAKRVREFAFVLKLPLSKSQLKRTLRKLRAFGTCPTLQNEVRTFHPHRAL